MELLPVSELWDETARIQDPRSWRLLARQGLSLLRRPEPDWWCLRTDGHRHQLPGLRLWPKANGAAFRRELVPRSSDCAQSKAGWRVPLAGARGWGAVPLALAALQPRRGPFGPAHAALFDGYGLPPRWWLAHHLRGQRPSQASGDVERSGELLLQVV